MKYRTLFGRTLFTVALLATSLAIGCATDKSIIAQAADTHKQLEPAVMTDSQLAGYVQQVGDRVVKSARELVQNGYKKDRIYAQDPSWMFDDVQFHLVNSETLNAFTTGGTHVYLYSQLFETTKNEDEFAAVVSHEFAHIVARHVAKGTNRQYATLGFAAAAAVGGYALGGDNKMETAAAAGGAGLVAGQFIGMGFTRKDEHEADKFGFQFYANAGWDPDKFGGFFQTLVDKGLDSSSAITSDHPLLKDRVVDAKEWSAEWKEKHPNWQQLRVAPIANASTFGKYQSRAVSVGKSTPNDKTLAAAKLMLNAFPSCVAPTDQPQQIEAREALGATVESSKKKKKK
jgi:predicted Zn-dependent protease